MWSTPLWKSPGKNIWIIVYCTSLAFGRGDGTLHLLARVLGWARLLACKSLERSRLMFWVMVYLLSFIDSITALLLLVMPEISSIVGSIIPISYHSNKMT